ncbi:MAG: metal-dependent transcriptional regulator [Bacteroidales bacterium]|nr:MAG: metal-dependent transcriptional regulator [Bacteroidales bacterium]
MSGSTENFLKAIYKITLEDKECATNTRLSKRLNISNAAVTDMSKCLARKGLVRYIKYKGTELTAEGRILALKIIRKHRLWELFLFRVLGYSWHEVHKDAEMLEHQTSEHLLDQLDKFLEQPQYDPHGEPIPDKHGKLPESDGFVKLTGCIEGKNYEIVRINPGTNDLNIFLKENGFHLGKNIFLKRIYEDIFEIILDNTKLLIPQSIAGNLFVIPK